MLIESLQQEIIFPHDFLTPNFFFLLRNFVSAQWLAQKPDDKEVLSSNSAGGGFPECEPIKTVALKTWVDKN